jgi:peroxiredoxin
MSGMSTESPTDQAQRPRLGLAVAALVFGLLSVGMSIVIVGGLAGIVGLVLAVMHLRRRPDQPRSMAYTGLVLSLAGVVASIGFGVFYYTMVDDVLTSIGSQANKWVGRESPDFTVTTMDGQTFKLSDFRGKRVVVDIWETWCGPCIEEIPNFNQLRTAVTEDDLALIGISSEKESILKPFLAKHEMAYTIASSQSLPVPYSNSYIIPTTFFIDRKGIIQSVLVGYHDFDTLKMHSTANDYEGVVKPSPDNPSSTTVEK